MSEQNSLSKTQCVGNKAVPPHPTLSSKPNGGADQAQDRRRAVRFECKRRNAWRLFATTTCYSGKGTVHDVSTNGISLSVDAVLRPGMFLDLNLLGEDEQSTSKPMLVRVRRVTPQIDGHWLVGCTFVKSLSKEELQAWF
jgi:hypothetical protein